MGNLEFFHFAQAGVLERKLQCCTVARQKKHGGRKFTGYKLRQVGVASGATGRSRQWERPS